MKVIHHKGRLHIPGELIVSLGYAAFHPDDKPHGPHALLIREPRVIVGNSGDDDSCIMIYGLCEQPYDDVKRETLFARVSEAFYPVTT